MQSMFPVLSRVPLAGITSRGRLAVRISCAGIKRMRLRSASSVAVWNSRGRHSRLNQFS